MYEYNCLEGCVLNVLMDQLDEYARGGWELVCATVVQEEDIIGVTHYLYIRRKRTGEG